jgi:CDP-2,3-bis-(O-geranylgeranyl)-sn-glycerol synthase
MEAMQPVLVFQLLVLIAVANGTPVIAKKLFGDLLASPLDGGAAFFDGRPVFGPSKTLRGVVLALLVTPLVALAMGLSWQLGLLVACGTMAGDLFSSFIKRRIGRDPSSMALGLDQIPESLFPLLLSGLLVPLGLIDVLAGVAIFAVAAPLVSRLCFYLRLRDQPY